MNTKPHYGRMRFIVCVSFMLLSLLALFLVVFVLSSQAQTTVVPPLRVSEVDGSPNKSGIYWLKFPNGSLSLSGTTMTVNVPTTSIANTWAATQTFSLPIQVYGGTVPGISFKPSAFGSFWRLHAENFIWNSVNDESFGIHYNEDGSITTQPTIGINWEPRYQASPTGNGALENNWEYTGLPGVGVTAPARQTFRWHSSNMALDNNYITDSWFIDEIQWRNKAADSPAFFSAQPNNRLLSINGRIDLSGQDAGQPTLHLQGSAASSSFFISQPSALANGQTVNAFLLPAHTGYVYGIAVEGSISAGLLQTLRNTSTNSSAVTRFEIQSNGSDPVIRFMGTSLSDIAIGIDRSDSGKFKLSQSDTLGNSDLFSVDTSGNAVHYGNLTLQSKFLDVASMTAPSSPASGTRRLYVDSGTGKLTLKKSDGSTVDLETGGGGGSITGFPDIRYYPAAVCNGENAASAFDLPASAALQPDCVIGTNTVKGVLNSPDSGSFSGMISFVIPSDYTGSSNVDVKVICSSPANSGNVKVFVASAFAATDGTEADDPAFNTANTQTVAVPATANRNFTVTFTSITVTGIGASKKMFIKVSRDGTDGSDTIGDVLRIHGIEVTVRRTI